MIPSQPRQTNRKNDKQNFGVAFPIFPAILSPAFTVNECADICNRIHHPEAPLQYRNLTAIAGYLGGVMPIQGQDSQSFGGGLYVREKQ